MLLEVKDLSIQYQVEKNIARAVNHISFSINENETLGLVGETGAGKTTTALGIMRLLPDPPGRITGGEILFNGKDLLKKSKDEMRSVRGKQISMIFQDPMTSLNPTMKIGKQLTESIEIHRKIDKEEAYNEALRLMKLVQIPNPELRINQYPHQFSGGMRQRVMIAMALSCQPKLLIADEPTTALDVTIQAQIIDLLKKINESEGTAVILITHDLGVVASMAQRINVMYAGRIMEAGSAEDIFYNASHPYTKGLLESLPTISTRRNEKLISIPGTPPNLLNPPVGCEFAARCRYAMKVCKEKQAPVFTINKGHSASCWLLHQDCPKEEKK